MGVVRPGIIIIVFRSQARTKLSFGIFEFTETATNTMITLPKGMENGKMEKRAHIVFLHQRHHMKLKNDVRPLIGRFFILVVSASSNETIVRLCIVVKLAR